MYALTGVSRFPIYFNHGKLVSRSQLDMDFVKYTRKHSKQKALIIKQFNGKERFFKRFLINGRIIHPSLKSSQRLINRVYIYPSDKYQTFKEEGLMIFCISIKVQKRYFIPMIPLQTLDEQEAIALELLHNKRKQDIDLGIEEILGILNDLEMQVLNQKVLVNGDISLSMHDTVLHKGYHILINSEGVLKETNVCYEPHDQVYIWEAIMDFRYQQHLHIYSPYNYSWVVSE